jgi:NAD(P)-dependent dehydrogenase (short-subunit alcohol dehydrogenase family)
MAASTADPRPTVLITGAAKRLGNALVRDFAARRWQVAIHCHGSRADADALAADIAREGGRAAVFAADLASDADVSALVPAVAARFSAPVCLVNNASLFVYDDVTSLDPAIWDRHMAINLKAPVFLAKAVAEHLPAGTHGNIVNIIDQRVWKPTPHFLSYATAKSALWAATQTLAQALAPRLRVNAIGPGPMLRSIHQSAEAFEAQTAATILQRGTTPAEVAAAIRFILDAPAMTGQMIALDGGQHLAWATPDIGDGRS